MTGFLVLLLLLALLVSGLELRHRRTGEAMLRRLRGAAAPGRPWWWAGPDRATSR